MLGRVISMLEDAVPGLSLEGVAGDAGLASERFPDFTGDPSPPVDSALQLRELGCVCCGAFVGQAERLDPVACHGASRCVAAAWRTLPVRRSLGPVHGDHVPPTSSRRRDVDNIMLRSRAQSRC